MDKASIDALVASLADYLTTGKNRVELKPDNSGSAFVYNFNAATKHDLVITITKPSGHKFELNLDIKKNNEGWDVVVSDDSMKSYFNFMKQSENAYSVFNFDTAGFIDVTKVGGRVNVEDSSIKTTEAFSIAN